MKNIDKLIVIVGAVIIVLAAIAIYFKPVPPSEGQEPKMKEFKVSWEERSGTAVLDNPDMFAYDRILSKKDQPYCANVTIHEYNLKSVKFVLTWEDDYVHGLLKKKKGRDTLTFEVIAPDGTKKVEESVGNGTIEFIFDNINYKPPVNIIKANDTEEAWQKIREYYGEKWKGEPFRLKVSVKVGEKLFSLRPWRRLLDKGNNFSITVEYTYYEAILEEVSTTTPTSYGGVSGIESTTPLNGRLYSIFAYPGFH